MTRLILLACLALGACGPTIKWQPPRVERDDGFYVPTICGDCDMGGVDGATDDGGDGGQP